MGWAVWLYDGDWLSCMSVLTGFDSGVYSVAAFTFSGVPSLGGVGGKLNELDVGMDEDEPDSCPAEFETWLRPLLLKGLIGQPECACGTMDFASVIHEWRGVGKWGRHTWLDADTEKENRLFKSYFEEKNLHKL